MCGNRFACTTLHAVDVEALSAAAKALLKAKGGVDVNKEEFKQLFIGTCAVVMWGLPCPLHHARRRCRAGCGD